MSAIIMDGKKLSEKLQQRLRDKIEVSDVTPKLMVISVGDDPASRVYVRNKERGCEKVGIEFEHVELPEDCSQEQLEWAIAAARRECGDTGGLILQLPVGDLDAFGAICDLDAWVDVDGFADENLSQTMLGEEPIHYPCTPLGVMELLKEYEIPLKGKHAVVIGRSRIVGRPLSQMLLKEDATVTICHSRTENLAEIVRTADVVISAVGKANLVTADMIKEGACVIDVGINRVDGKLCGDVDFEHVKEVAGFITPVPGGVGPMTVTMLLYNTAGAAGVFV